LPACGDFGNYQGAFASVFLHSTSQSVSTG